jgi:hypothetical protein
MFRTQIRPLEHARNCFHVPWRGAEHVSGRVDASKVGRVAKMGLFRTFAAEAPVWKDRRVVRKECVVA